MMELYAFLQDEEHKNDKETAIIFEQDGPHPHRY
jgi:hypothetical protein